MPFVLVCFAANSLITRYIVAHGLLDAGLLTATRFIAGAMMLVLICVVRRERVVVGRANLLPALWLGLYAVCISYGYQYIGAAAGTFVFYATVLLTLIGVDLASGSAVPKRRALGAGVSLIGIGVLAGDSVGAVTVLGVVLLIVSGASWGLYTAAGRKDADPRVTTTGHFLVLAVVLVVPAGAAVVVAGGLPVTTSGVVLGAAMGAGTTALAYVAWYACQRSMSATAAGSAQLLIPIITTAGAVLLLGERLSATLGIAAILVCAGLWLGRPVPSPSTIKGPGEPDGVPFP